MLPESRHSAEPDARQNAAAWMIGQRRLLAVLGAAILAAAWLPASQLEMDRTIGQMFAEDDPTLVAYEQLRAAFGGNAVIMLVYRDDQLWSEEGLRRAGSVADRVADVPGVRGVLSVAQLNDVLKWLRPGGLLSSAGQPASPLLRDDDPVVARFEQLFAGYTHSENRRVASIVALLDEAPTERGHGDTIDGLEAVTRSMPEDAREVVLVGEPVLLEQGLDLIERDGRWLAWLTIALLSPCVLLMIRSLRFVALQAIVILWAVTLTRATLFVLGFELSLVSSILTAIVTVITVTSVIHMGSRQRRLRQQGYRTEAAAERAFGWLLPPVFWACATDAAGFAALTVSGIVPVREFGVMMAIASLAVFAGLLLFAPLVVTGGALRAAALDGYAQLFDPRRLAKPERRLRKCSLRLAVVLVRWRRLVFAVATLLACLTWLGLGRLQIESSFLRNFRADSSLVRAYDMVESELSGAGVWDVILPAPDEMTVDYIDQVLHLEQRLRGIAVDGQRLTKVLSITDLEHASREVPLLALASPAVRLAGMRSAIPAFSDALLVPKSAVAQGQQRKLRVMLRSHEHLPAETKVVLIEEVERVVQRHTSTAQWRQSLGDDDARPGQVTGYYVMLARLVTQLISDQWRCLVVAALLVWLLLLAATRSFSLASLALVPNLLPVLAVLAALGLSDVKMNMGAAMIAAVSIGLSIDGSVHFMSNYRRKRRRFRGQYHAVLFAQKQIGLPLMMATLALAVGFCALALSEFVPTTTFGLLTAAALVTGTATNLSLLPAMLGRRPHG